MKKPILYKPTTVRNFRIEQDLWDKFAKCVRDETGRGRQAGKAIVSLISSFVDECEAEQAAQTQVQTETATEVQ